jgi:ribosomal protein S18 acetylase RimI-like enzyme
MKIAVTHRPDDTYIEKAWKHAEMEEIENLAVELLGKAQEAQSIEDDLFCILYLAFRRGFKWALGNNGISMSERIQGQIMGPTTDIESGIVQLGTEDTAEMLALIGETKPGPFGPRICELGLYGMRRLIAIGGERLRIGGHVELSAIAVHPGPRGCRLDGAVTAYSARAAIARGEIPFVHVFPSNSAGGLYQRIGFRMHDALGYLNRLFIEPVAVFFK